MRTWLCVKERGTECMYVATSKEERKRERMDSREIGEKVRVITR